MREWADIQRDLEEAFSGGIDRSVGGQHLGPILDGERRYGEHLVSRFHGYQIVIDSFFEFFAETLKAAPRGLSETPLPNGDKTYTPLFLTYLGTFRRFRACEALKNAGYPLDAFALLRDVKDRALCIGAIIDGYTTIHRLEGFQSLADSDRKISEDELSKIKARGKKENSAAIRRMVGNGSGLEQGDIAQLERWRDLFHEETHGSRFGRLGDFDTLVRNNQALSLAPTPQEGYRDAAMFMNRSIEVAWMVHRCLPFLQTGQRIFGEDWEKKWLLLDEAFQVHVKGLAEIGKEIANTFARLIKAKFSFTPSTHYVDRK